MQKTLTHAVLDLEKIRGRVQSGGNITVAELDDLLLALRRQKDIDADRIASSTLCNMPQPVAVMQHFPKDQVVSQVYTALRPAWLAGIPSAGTHLYTEHQIRDAIAPMLELIEKDDLDLRHYEMACQSHDREITELKATLQRFASLNLGELQRYGDNEWAATADPEFGPRDGGDYVKFADVQRLFVATSSK